MMICGNIDTKILTKIAMKIVQKSWGEESWLVNTKEYCAKILMINPGKSCSRHMHKIKKESFVPMVGVLFLEVWNKAEGVSRGNLKSTLTISPGTFHKFYNMTSGKVFFLEVSTYHSDNDVVREEV